MKAENLTFSLLRVCAMLAGVAFATWTIGQKLNSIESNISDLKTQIRQAQEDCVAIDQFNRWTIRQQSSNVKNNPSIEWNALPPKQSAMRGMSESQ